jgi:hypothetical protein
VVLIIIGAGLISYSEHAKSKATVSEMAPAKTP